MSNHTTKSKKLSFKEQVAIVTGAGNGLGRSHALALAARGAKVVVNDLGGSVDGTGGSLSAAEETVALIKAAGGEAIANGANVTSFTEVEAMVADAMERWGRVDILINNAGILRDKSFAKMELEDFCQVIDVHLMGSVNCCKAVWEIMRVQKYGRIVMTASSSGLYGNFGQANYGAAKMALVGLMNTLVLEGEKYNIRVNTLSPAATTRMTKEVIPEKALKLMTPEAVTAGLLVLCHQDAPNRCILCAGAGVYSTSHVMDTGSVYLSSDAQTPENIMEKWGKITDLSTVMTLEDGNQHIGKFVQKAFSS